MRRSALFLGLGTAISVSSFAVGFTALSLTSPQNQALPTAQIKPHPAFKSAMVRGKDRLEVQNVVLIQKALSFQAQQLQHWQEEQNVRHAQLQRVPSAVVIHERRYPQQPQSERSIRSLTDLPSVDRLAVTSALAEPPPTQNLVPAMTLRVAIGQGLHTVVAGGSTPIQILDLERRMVQEVPASTALVFQANQSIIWNGVQSATPIWLHLQDDGFVLVGDRWYRGEILLIPQGNSMLVVSYVDLEQYLYSVVGAEMPSYWAVEALKAQAIAARSYALAHRQRPASPWYDLTNTERHQVYGGIDTETSQSQLAVEGTRGLFLVENGQVFEAMYASTDEVVAKHHAGHPSMSQTGAQQKAALGLNHLQILGDYYQKIGLARLE